jgi:hypothetical protein
MRDRSSVPGAASTPVQMMPELLPEACDSKSGSFSMRAHFQPANVAARRAAMPTTPPPMMITSYTKSGEESSMLVVSTCGSGEKMRVIFVHAPRQDL